MWTVAVVLAGGTGRRFGSDVPKQLLALRGRSLVRHCVDAFGQAAGVDTILVVAAAPVTARLRSDLADCDRVAEVIEGGAERADSTRAAIQWLTRNVAAGTQHDCKVLFHDAARPLVDQRIINDCVAALDDWRAVGVIVPSSDTVVEVADGQIQRVLARDTLGRCQTPQGFWLSVISEAHRLAAADPAFAAVPATDDCGVVLRYLPDVGVGAVTGSQRNLKITYAADLAIAEALLDADHVPD